MKDRYIALIDGDELVYKAAFANQKVIYKILQCYEDEEFNLVREVISFSNKKEAIAFIENNKDKNYRIEAAIVLEDVSKVYLYLQNILETIKFDLNTNVYSIFLHGKDNFRTKLWTLKEYKAGRAERPVYYIHAREYLVNEELATVVHGQESDDALGIMANIYKQEGKYEPVIVSQDKDLNMIAGWHYNINSGKLVNISEFNADKSFYIQLLTGDLTDNIPGIHGCGIKTAEKLLEPCTSIRDMYNVVLESYRDAEKRGKLKFDTSKTIEEIILELGNLLWIRREQDREWIPPV